MSVPIALPTAVAYGVADFTGGLAARRAPVLAVTAVVQLVGLLALLPVALLVPGSPSGRRAAGRRPGRDRRRRPGCCSTCGRSRSGRWVWWRRCRRWSAPGCRCWSGVLRGERPGPVTVLAVAVALVAIVLATAGTGRAAGTRIGPVLGLVAGVGFGLFFIGLDATPRDSGLWPLVAGRLVMVAVLAALVADRPVGHPRRPG